MFTIRCKVKLKICSSKIEKKVKRNENEIIILWL